MDDSDYSTHSGYGIPAEYEDDFMELLATSGGTEWDRPALSQQQRVIVSLGILVGKGTDAPLRNYINRALDIGLSRDEVYEVIRHSAQYHGFPQALTAMRQLGLVYASRTKHGRS